MKPSIIQILFAGTFKLDVLVKINAAKKPTGIGIDEFNVIVVTDKV